MDDRAEAILGEALGIEGLDEDAVTFVKGLASYFYWHIYNDRKKAINVALPKRFDALSSPEARLVFYYGATWVKWHDEQNYEASYHDAEKLIGIARELQLPVWEARGLLYEAWYFFKINRIDDAVGKARKSVEQANAANARGDEADAWVDLSIFLEFHQPSKLSPQQ